MGIDLRGGDGEDDRREDEEKVGYAKPPKRTRWKKGQSGNPKGRPKGARGLKSDLDRVLKKVLIIEGRGTTLKGTTQLLALEMLARRAARGDVRSIKALIDLIMAVFGPGDRGGDREQLSEADQKLLDRWLAGLAGSEGPASGMSSGESDGRQADASVVLNLDEDDSV